MKLFRREFILKLLLLALLYSLVPLAEIFLILHLGEIIGNYLVIALTAAAGLFGMLTAFGEIESIIRQIKVKLKEGIYPEKEFNSLAGVFSGALLLLTPGFITDLFGLLLFVPVVRDIIGRFIASKLDIQLKEIYEYLKVSDSL